MITHSIIRHLLLLTAAFGLVALTGCTTTGESASTAEANTGSSFKETQAAVRSKKSYIPYPFETCAVINKHMKGNPKHRRIYDGYEVLFCCTPCVRAFDTTPEAFMPRIRAAAR